MDPCWTWSCSTPASRVATRSSTASTPPWVQSQRPQAHAGGGAGVPTTAASWPSAVKSMSGHLVGGAGALEAVAVLLSMQHRLIPPTMGTSEPDPAMPAIGLVLGDPRAWEPGPTLSNSFGFGGHNGTLVLGPA